MQEGFISVAIGLSGQPSDFVVKALLTGVSESVVLPKGKYPVDTLADGFRHLFQAVNCGYLGFLAPEYKGLACGGKECWLSLVFGVWLFNR